MTRNYDVIVAGFRPGGLLAAALLAGRGFKVLVTHKEPSEPLKRGSFIFPSHRYPLVGLEHPDLLGGVLDELSIHPSERKVFQTTCPAFQVILPEHRVDVYPDARFTRELEREFRADSGMLEALYARSLEDAGYFLDAWRVKCEQLPVPSWTQKMGLGSFGRKDKPLFPMKEPSLSEFYAQHEAPPHVRAFLNAQLLAFGYVSAPEYMPLPVACHLLSTVRTGLYSDPEQQEPLEKLLVDKILALHSEVEPERRVEGIEASWGKVSALTFEGESLPVTCDWLIWNASYDGLLEVLPEGLRRKGYSDHYPAPELMRYDIQLVVDDFVIPVGMQENAVLVRDPERPLQDGNLMWLSMSPDGVESWAPLGARTLTLSTLIGSGEDARTRDALHGVARGMIEHLGKVIPWLRKYIQKVYVPVPGADDLPGDPIFDARALTKLYPQDLGPGPRLPHWNFFHLGRETWPMAGFDGEIGAAMLIERAIASLADRRG